MRKIEEQMLSALEGRKDWIKDNTCVVFSDHIGNPYLDATIYLHNHSIAYLLPDNSIEVDNDTLRRYPTVTTKSRLRALGCNVFTRKGITYLDDVEV